jgi:DNA gyrase/topoisomerase IV subunit A
MDGVYGRIVNWLEIDENKSWDMGDMYGLEMIGELNEKELVEELKNLREEIEVMKRVLENVEEIEEVYYEEYLKRRSF